MLFYVKTISMLKEKQKPKRISKTSKMSKWIKRTSDLKANVKLVKRAKSWNVIRNTRHIAWAVELTYVHVVDKRKSHWVARVRRVAQLLSKFLFVNQNQALFSSLQTKKILSKGPPKQADTAIAEKPCLAMAEFDTKSAKETNHFRFSLKAEYPATLRIYIQRARRLIYTTEI